MSHTALLPFDSVQRTAETFADPRIKSQLLAELARSQLLTEQFDAALQTLVSIPLPQERRIALLTADYKSFPPEKIEPLIRLLANDQQTQFLAGHLALAMLEAQNVRSAWKLVETAKEPFVFESDKQRYSFLDKVLPQINASDWEKITRFHHTFTEQTYNDWASLAICNYLVRQQRDGETTEFINAISSSLRRSWVYWEMCRLSSAKRSENFFDKAVKILETATITTDDEEMERLATQLRILGRAAVQRGNKEQGEQLLERSESVIASLPMPMQRYRLQCFLGKVLWELRLVDSIQVYVPIETMLKSLSSNADRSRVLVWLTEAGYDEGWAQAIEAATIPERGVLESDRAEQIAQVLKRFTAHQQGFKSTGDPSEDATRLSGEEFETLYFSPFAESDCGC